MRAKYFRFMYQNVEGGSAHTLSVADTERGNNCNVFYVSSLKGTAGANMRLDDRFLSCSETIDLLAVADFEKATVEQALKLMESNRVEKVILPDEGIEVGKVKEAFLSKGASQAISLKAGEVFEFAKAGWKVKAGCFGKETSASLVMFHGPEENSPEKDDCVLTVKPSAESLPCTACVDGVNHNCGMRCGLYNDFNTCKGHNAKNSEGYVTGTLLLGNVDLTAHGSEVKQMFEEEKSGVRFVTLPNGGSGEYITNSFLNWIDTVNENVNRYYLAPSGAEGNGEALMAILKKGPRHIPVLTNSRYGLCASGFFKKRI